MSAQKSSAIPPTKTEEFRSFVENPDTSVTLRFNAIRNEIHVLKDGIITNSYAAWSGGGKTDPRYTAERAKNKYAVPEFDAGYSSEFTKASHKKTTLAITKNGISKHREVSSSRGGILPTGHWIAVRKMPASWAPPKNPAIKKDKNEGAATDWRPTVGLSTGDYSWWLYPLRLSLGHNVGSKHQLREYDTFYIHWTGPLGSDGCIVMSAADLGKLDSALGKRPYTLLESFCLFPSDSDIRDEISHYA